MPRPLAPKPPKLTPQRMQLALGALLTLGQLGKMMLEGKRDLRACPRCAYRMVEPIGRRRRAGELRRNIHVWRCAGCRAEYESAGPSDPFETPGLRR
jgi:hypothetical protein